MEMLKKLPEEYLEVAKERGTIEKVEYMVGDICKYAYVYLPYGYDASKEYDIVYCLHGGGGEIEVYFGTDEKPGAAVYNTIDHMIEDKLIKPVIAVSPTYYKERIDHNLEEAVADIEAFTQKELVENLMPAVEGKYSTYAKSTDNEGLRNSREHRAYCGYSMGSLSTWYSYINSSDYIKYFMPMSGDFWTNGVSDEVAATKRFDDAYDKEVCIYAVTGDCDIAYERMKNMLEYMKDNSEKFIFEGENKNISFAVEPKATHDYIYMPLYFYNGLVRFFK